MDETTIGTPVGPYGTVIEHPLIRGLFYMVLHPVDQGENSFLALVLADSSPYAAKQASGEIVVCGGYLQSGERYSDWLVVE